MLAIYQHVCLDALYVDSDILDCLELFMEGIGLSPGDRGWHQNNVVYQESISIRTVYLNQHNYLRCQCIETLKQIVVCMRKRKYFLD